MNEDERYRRAKARVEQLVGFYSHAGVYALVNGMLFIINILTSPGDPWFFWPLMGWGIGLAAHGFGVFVAEGPLDKDWQERKIREFAGHDREYPHPRSATDRDQGRSLERPWPDLGN